MYLTASSCEQYFKLGSATRRHSVIGCNGYEIANPITDNNSNIAVETKDATTSTTFTSTSVLVEEKTCASTCAICMEDVGQKNTASTECGHTFCLSCLLNQLKHSNSCPLCRTPIDQNAKKILKPLTYSDGISLLDHELTSLRILEDVEQYVQNAIEISANPQTDGHNVQMVIEDLMNLITVFGFNLLYDTVCHANGGEQHIDQEWIVEMYGDDDSDDSNSDDSNSDDSNSDDSNSDDSNSDDSNSDDSNSDDSNSGGDVSTDADISGDDDDDDLSKNNNNIGFGLPEVPEWMLE
jgi:Ring finger domain